MARAATPQLQAVLRRAHHLAYRHLDDAHRYGLAGLPPYQISAPAGYGQLRRTDTDVSSRAVRRGSRRPAEPAARFDMDADPGYGAIAGACSVDTFASHHDYGNSDPECVSGFHQRF